MQCKVVAFLILVLSAGSALAQTFPAAPSAPSSDATLASVEAGKLKTHAAAVANCEALWDRATHMTRKEWSGACRRVQLRLQKLELR
jgi:hypothetical protein